MILLLLSFLFLHAEAQIPLASTPPMPSNCKTLNPFATPFQHNLVVFGDFDARGSLEGTIVVQGDFNSTQIDIATLGLSNEELFAALVGGSLIMQCGTSNGNLFHIGEINLGPGVNLGEYAEQPIPVNELYDFSNSASTFNDICTDLQSVSTINTVGYQGDTLRLTGHGDQTELFNVDCDDISNAKVIRFLDVSDQDTTTIIINIKGNDCTLDVDNLDISGLGFKSPGGHILWTHCPTQEPAKLTLGGDIVGSILAPSTHVISNSANVQGQIIVGSLEGTIYSSRQLFRGCIPTDHCSLVARHCEFQQRPVCPNPTSSQDPNNPCCTIWECGEECEPCPDVLVTCNELTESPAIIAEAGTPGFDLCCDTWGCIPENPDNDEDPFVTGCPDDIVVQLTPGRMQVTVEWEPPTFLFTRSVTPSHNPPLVVGEGSYYITYIAEGLQSGTKAGCFFEIIVKPFAPPGSCSAGGVFYGEGEWFYNDCALKCECVNGEATDCRRVRPALLGMTDKAKEYYWSIFIAVYNHPDGIIAGFVNNHVQMFSRGLHNNGAFLPWHRGYILATENRFRELDCRVTIPYWDQQTQPRINQNNIWGPEPHHCSGNGDRGSRCVMTGTFGLNNGFAQTNGRCLQRRITGGAAATSATVQTQIYNLYPNSGDFDRMRNRLEHGPGFHDSIHCIVGGTMCSARSSNDPVFFSHHANVDRIWWVWQQKSADHMMAYTGRTGLNDIMPVSPYTPYQMLDMMNFPDLSNPNARIAVNYFRSDAYLTLDQIMVEMLPNELNLVGTSGTVVTSSAFFIDMNMGDDQITLIQEAERLAQNNDVKEALVLTLENVVDRTSGSPNFARALELVTKRLAQLRNADGEMENPVAARHLWLSLAQTMIAENVVPPFTELQEILYVDDDDNVVDVTVISVPIGCVPTNDPVCAQGIQFNNACEAENAGYNGWTGGNCPTPTVPEPLPEGADGGDSLDYNHEQQELAECPGTKPLRLSMCSVPGVVCYYGVMCCDIFKTTMTCVDQSSTLMLWTENTQAWDSCDGLQCNGDETRTTRAPTPRPTNRPTRAPTRRPTRRPTRAPTRAPTRPNTVPQTRRPTNHITSTRSPTRSPTPRPSASPWSDVSDDTREDRPRGTRPVNGPTGPPIIVRPPARPSPSCPPINHAACVEVRGCGRLSQYVQQPVINGCDQNCPMCMTIQLPYTVTRIPTCFRGDAPVCTLLSCPGDQVATLIQTKGAHGSPPCCDRYQCGCPPNIICDLSLTQCTSPGTIARWKPDGTMAPGGCCRAAECVSTSCSGANNVICPDGSIYEPDWRLNCAVAPCPLVCPDDEIRMCDVSSLVNPARQIPQVRGDPFVEDNVVKCNWQPCPPYEPCDDTAYTPNQRRCNNNGQCLTNLNSFRCDCDETHEGIFCETRKTVPRVVLPLKDRSAGFLTDQCTLILCQDQNSVGECFVAILQDSFNTAGSKIRLNSVRSMLDNGVLNPVQFVGAKGDALWFLNNLGNPVKVTKADEFDLFGAAESDESTDAEFQRITTGSSNDNFESRAIESYSYQTATSAPPPVSEYRFVLKPDPNVGSCTPWLYFTDTAIGVYWSSEVTSDYFHSITWGPGIQVDFDIDNLAFIDSSISEEICENKCIIGAPPVLELCNSNGICNPETGLCMCNFGWLGDKCEDEAWTGDD